MNVCSKNKSHNDISSLIVGNMKNEGKFAVRTFGDRVSNGDILGKLEEFDGQCYRFHIDL